MSWGEWVRDERGRRYRLLDGLGSGAIAAVYRGRPEHGPEDGSRDVAIKMPHPLLPRDLLERFWSERENLEVLCRNAERRGWGHLFPHAWRGYTEQGGAEVLLMDLAPGKRLVAMAAEGKGGCLPEEFGLAAGLQYAQLLQVLHEDAGMSCADRKPNDFYWDDDKNGGKLMVLDWNVVRSGKEKNVPQDIYVFGRIWYEMLLGSPPLSGTDRVGRDITAHSGWEGLSYGTRAILRQALQSDPDRRQKSARVLAEQVEQHWKDWRAPSGHGLQERGRRELEKARATQDEAQRRLRQATALVKQRYLPEAGEIEGALDGARRSVGESGPALFEALRLLDLAQLKQVADSERWLAQAEKLARERNELLVEGCRQLELIQYSAAGLWLQVAQDAVADDPQSRLQVSRWITLAQAGREAIAAGGGIKDYVPQLTTIAAYLDAGRAHWRDAEGDWQRLHNDLAREWPPGSRVGDLLGSLAGEAAFWGAWSRAVEDERKRAYGDAAEGYRKARQQLDLIAYGDNLEATLETDLTERINACVDRAQTEGRVQQCIEEGKSRLQEGDFRELDIFGVQAAWRRGRALAAGDPMLMERVASALGPEQLLSLLRRLQLAHSGRAWDMAMALARELALEFSDHPQACGWIQQVVRDIYVARQEMGPTEQNVATLKNLRDLWDKMPWMFERAID